MSEMSFKQAKEVMERLELSEVTLQKTLANIHKTSKNLDRSLDKQNNIIDALPKAHNKINNLRLLVVLNVGFILGLVAAKFLF
jgi:hypothetical protein